MSADAVRYKIGLRHLRQLRYHPPLNPPRRLIVRVRMLPLKRPRGRSDGFATAVARDFCHSDL